MFNIVPPEEIELHTCDDDCICRPTVKDLNGDIICIHNPFDKDIAADFLMNANKIDNILVLMTKHYNNN
jgi:hypothetical protein